MQEPMNQSQSPTEVVEPEVVAPDVDATPEEKVSVEEFTINGDALVAKIKELIHQGNIRRIILKNEEGKPLIEIPLTIGVVGGVLSATLFPVLAAVGVIGAMVTHLTIVIEKRE